MRRNAFVDLDRIASAKQAAYGLAIAAFVSRHARAIGRMTENPNLPLRVRQIASGEFDHPQEDSAFDQVAERRMRRARDHRAA